MGTLTLTALLLSFPFKDAFEMAFLIEAEHIYAENELLRIEGLFFGMILSLFDLHVKVHSLCVHRQSTCLADGVM